MTLGLITKGLINTKDIYKILCPEISIGFQDDFSFDINVEDIIDISVEIQGDFII